MKYLIEDKEFYDLLEGFKKDYIKNNDLVRYLVARFANVFYDYLKTKEPYKGDK